MKPRKKEQLILIKEKQEGKKGEEIFLKLCKPKETFKTKNNKEKSLKIIKRKKRKKE